MSCYVPVIFIQMRVVLCENLVYKYYASWDDRRITSTYGPVTAKQNSRVRTLIFHFKKAKISTFYHCPIKIAQYMVK